jgi:hypothetical protein
MDSNEGASVYAEAKGEYTKQLTLYVVPSFHKFFMLCLHQAMEEEQNPKRQLWKFQEILSQIPEWNVDKVQREISKILSSIDCDYFDELITAVFIAHTKVLTAIRLGQKNKNRVQIVVPKTEHFLHRSLSECSRLLWASAFLFHSELSAMEKQKNHRQIETLLHEGVGQAIRALLPVKNILKDCITDGDDNEDDDADGDVEVSSDKKDTSTVKQDNEESIDEVHVSDKEIIEPTVDESVVPVPSVPVPVVVKESVLVVPDVPAAAPTVAPTAAPTVAPAAAPTVAPAVAPAVTVSPNHNLVINTEPSVHFTNFDQVIQNQGDTTTIQYIEKNRDLEDEENEMIFEGDDMESLSDFEDINDSPLDGQDFESL